MNADWKLIEKWPIDKEDLDLFQSRCWSCSKTRREEDLQATQYFWSIEVEAEEKRMELVGRWQITKTLICFVEDLVRVWKFVRWVFINWKFPMSLCMHIYPAYVSTCSLHFTMNENKNKTPESREGKGRGRS